jgi:hypothetical protein
MLPEEKLWLQGLEEGRSMRFRPLGRSMTPCLRPGDIVSICPGKTCHTGDIVLWKKRGVLVLHRVVGRKNGHIITKGDSLRGLDALVLREQILGRAVSRERRGRLRRLDHLGARFLGLAFSFTMALLPGLISLLVRLKNRRKELGQVQPGYESVKW